MAVSTTEFFKLPVQLTLIVCILTLFLNNCVCIFYSSVILVPLILVATHYFILPPVPSIIADEVLGSPYSLNPNDNKGRKPILIAHRTSGLEAPENTLAGIRKAKDDGATGVEFDVRFTKDDVPVLMHDHTVDRTTDGSGQLSHLTLTDLKKLDASSHHFNHSRYKGENIPTLEEAIQLCLDLNLKIFWEAKDVDERAIQTITEMFKQKRGLYEKCAIVSFYPHFLYKLRKLDPSIITVLVWRPKVLSMESWNASGINCIPRFPNNKFRHLLMTWADEVLEWAVHNFLWRLCGVSGVFIHKSVISHKYLGHWAAAGMRVLAWVVDDPFEKEYFNCVLGLNYMTDTPRSVLNHINNMKNDKIGLI